MCPSFQGCIIVINMINHKRFSIGVLALVMFAASFASADAASVSIQDIVPGTTVPARDLITFNAVPVGFTGLLYVLSDSFVGAASTSITSSNISGGGKFSWTPTVNDVGTHAISIAISDNVGNSASTTQMITVAPPASVVIESISPGTNIMPGTKLTFVAKASGFTNPKFIAGGSYSGGTSITNANIDASGNFSWTPDLSENGEHRLNIYVTDSLGHGASASLTILVGTGPTLSAQSFPSSTTTSPGQNISFILSPSNYAPTGFSLIETFSGTTSTLTNQHLSSSGSFAWTPLSSDIGTHVIKLIGTVGVYGQNASTTVTVDVVDPNAPPPVVSVAPTQAATTSLATTTSSGTLADLLAAVALIEKQIAEASAADAGATPVASISSDFKFSSYLRPGAAGDEVKQLQIILAQEGFFSANANGRFGPLTVAAVKKLQAAHELPQLGVVGPATRAALNVILSGSLEGASATTPSPAGVGYVFKNFIGRGDDGVDVLELQKRLALLGYFSLEPNGHFGPATEQAVKKFQSANGIRAAGYVGPSTRAALNK